MNKGGIGGLRSTNANGGHSQILEQEWYFRNRLEVRRNERIPDGLNAEAKPT